MRTLSLLLLLLASCAHGSRPRTVLTAVSPASAPLSLAGREIQVAPITWQVPWAFGGYSPTDWCGKAAWCSKKTGIYKAAIGRALTEAGLKDYQGMRPPAGTPVLQIGVIDDDGLVWTVRYVVDGMPVASFEYRSDESYVCGASICSEDDNDLAGHPELVARNARAIVTQLLSLPAVTGVAAKPAAVAAAPAAPARAAWLDSVQQGSRLAVLEFRGALEQNVLLMFSDEARAGALQSLRGTGCSVMTRESMAAVLTDMGITNCVEGECEVETARNIGASYVVTGEILQWQGQHMAVLKLHETEGGSLLATKRVTAKDPLQLLEAIKPAALGLFE